MNRAKRSKDMFMAIKIVLKRRFMQYPLVLK